MKVVITREEWINGDTFRAYWKSGLHTPEGKKCCLGFVCEQTMGIHLEKPRETSDMLSFPHSLRGVVPHESFNKLPSILLRKLTPQDRKWLSALVEERGPLPASRTAELHYKEAWENTIAFLNDVQCETWRGTHTREDILSTVFERLGLEVEFVSREKEDAQSND